MSDMPNEPFQIDEEPKLGDTTPSQNDKALAGCAYISQFVIPAVLPVVLLLTDEAKRSSFIKYHAVMSLGLTAAAVVYEIVAGIVFAITAAIIPCIAAITWVLFLLPIVPMVYYGIKAFQGEIFDIPYLTDFCRKNGWV